MQELYNLQSVHPGLGVRWMAPLVGCIFVVFCCCLYSVNESHFGLYGFYSIIFEQDKSAGAGWCLNQIKSINQCNYLVKMISQSPLTPSTISKGGVQVLDCYGPNKLYTCQCSVVFYTALKVFLEVAVAAHDSLHNKIGNRLQLRAKFQN